MNQERVLINNIAPQLQCGAFFIKRVTGEVVQVTADVLGDGHDIIQAELCYKHQNVRKWQSIRMTENINDIYSAAFTTERQGFYEYKIRGWVDNPLNWQHGIEAKLKDNQHVTSELLDGVQYLNAILDQVDDNAKHYLSNVKDLFTDESKYEEAIKYAVSEDLHRIFLDNPTRKFAAESKSLKVYVDRIKARFSTWYEFFPRSAAQEPGQHGTFADCERLLPRVSQMGFDTLYFPPIHPIGEVNRKGKDNTTTAEEGDSGVPWGIGSRFGGHKAIHPQLGNEKDFKKLIKRANEMGIEVAMDLAFQAAPDHPYLKENPQWFKWRPDGTMQYAEKIPSTKNRSRVERAIRARSLYDITQKRNRTTPHREVQPAFCQGRYLPLRCL